jgi:hypothetical protein
LVEARYAAVVVQLPIVPAGLGVAFEHPRGAHVRFVLRRKWLFPGEPVVIPRFRMQKLVHDSSSNCMTKKARSAEAEG